jgi:hypothetical protein
VTVFMVLTQESQQAAFDKANAISLVPPLPPGQMNAALEMDVRVWAERLWEQAQVALVNARQKGMEAARPYIASFSAMLDEIAEKAQEHATIIGDRVAERMNTYVQGSIDSALSRLQPTLTVDSRKMRISNVTVEQKIKLSGSLKASLEGICEFTAEGELTLAVEYSHEMPVAGTGSSLS